MTLANAIADLRSLMADGPYTITVGAVTKECLFEETDGLALQPLHHAPGTPQIVTHAIATVITSDFPALKGADACTIHTKNDAGAITDRTFTVWQRMRIADGLTTELMLRVA